MEDDLRSAAQRTPSLTSTRSVTSCIKAALVSQALVAVGDTKYARFSRGPLEEEPFIFLTVERWNALLRTVRLLDLAANDPTETGLVVTLEDDGGVALTSVDDGTSLRFTSDEAEAFVLGVKDGELTTTALAMASA